ncbi:unnamed protein product, partial [Adineta steineri]
SFRKRNGGEIHQRCIACGYTGTINMASHKLTTYIAKNPPDAEDKSETTTTETKTKGKSKGKKKEAGGTKGDSDEGSPNENNSKTNGTSKNGGGSGGDEDDDEDWGDDLSPTMTELNTQIKGMIQTDDLDKPLAERCDKFKCLVEKNKKEDKLKDIDTIKDLIAEAERLEIMEQAPFVVGQSVFTENILKEIDEYKSLLTRVCCHQQNLLSE